MNNCPFERNVHRLADGESTPTEAREAESHIAECASCAALVADVRALKKLTGAMEPAKPSAEFFDRVRRAARALPEAGQAVSERFSIETWSRRLIPIAACLCILLGMIAFMKLRSSAAASAMSPTYMAYALDEENQAFLAGTSESSIQNFYQRMK